MNATELQLGAAEGVVVGSSRSVHLAAVPLASAAIAAHYGFAESAVVELSGLYAVENFELQAIEPPGTAVRPEIRGRTEHGWTEWRRAPDLEDVAPVSAIQTRIWLESGTEDVTPSVTGGVVSLAPAVQSAQMAARRIPTVRLWATREGLVGGTTANGHVITERDHFVALPSKRALNRIEGNDYMVLLRYRERTAVAPVWDIGPWNMRDDYWNDSREQSSDLPRWLPQAEAAFFQDYNGGRDTNGRYVTIPASIDIADGTFIDDLGMTNSDWVEVSFLWVDAASPAPRPTPVVVAKSPPPGFAGRDRASSYSGIKPSPRLSLPLVQNDPTGWSTTIVIQNPGPAVVSASISVRDATGVPVGQAGLSLPPFGSVSMPISSVPGVTVGFVGGALITANGPLAAVAVGDRAGMDRWAYEGVGDVGNASILPLVFRDYHGWNTGLQLQNLSAQPTIAQIQYLSDAGSRVESVSIGPLATHTVYPAGGSVLAGPFAGSALIQTDVGQPVTAVATHVNSAGAAMAYPGIGSGADKLFAPLVFNRYHGWSSGLRLLNLAPQAVGAVVGYRGLSLGGTEAQENRTVPGSQALTLYQPAEPQLPEGFVGSASVVTTPGSYLSGIVSKVKAGGSVAMAYVAGRPAGPLVAAPSVVKGSDRWNSGIQIQNPAATPAGFVLSFYDEDGDLVHRIESSVDAGSTQTYYLPSLAEIPPGFRGSAIVQSSPVSQGLIVIVNETAD